MNKEVSDCLQLARDNLALISELLCNDEPDFGGDGRILTVHCIVSDKSDELTLVFGDNIYFTFRSANKITLSGIFSSKDEDDFSRMLSTLVTELLR